MKKVLLFFMLSLCLQAKVQKHLSLDVAKYKEDFKHFSYVNPHAPKGGIIKVGDIFAFDTLNPFTVKGICAPALHLAIGTLFFESEDEPASSYPYIASAVDIRRDEIVFFINPQARFSDNTPITAQDIIFSFNQLQDSKHPKATEIYKDVDSVYERNTQTVVFKLKSGNADIVAFHLGRLPILSKTSVNALKNNKCEPFITSGPYKYKTIASGKKIVYERQKDWWGNNLPALQGYYNFDQVEYTIYTNDLTRFEDFKKSDLDIRYEISIQNWAIGYEADVLKKVNKIVVQQDFPKPTSGIVLNARRPFLKDVRIRKAVAYAFDFHWINKNLFYNLMQRNKSYFPKSVFSSDGKLTDDVKKILQLNDCATDHDLNFPDLQDYETPHQKRTAFQKAEDLLKDAGCTTCDGRVFLNGRPLNLTFVLDSPRVKKIALALAENLKKMGIQLDVLELDRQNYMKRVDSGDFDLCCDLSITTYQHSLKPGAELKMYFASFGNLNHSGVHDKKIDEVLVDIEKLKDKNQLTAMKALDYLLLKGYYRILGWHFDGMWFALSHKIESKMNYPKYIRMNVFFDSKNKGLIDFLHLKNDKAK